MRKSGWLTRGIRPLSGWLRHEPFTQFNWPKPKLKLGWGGSSELRKACCAALLRRPDGPGRINGLWPKFRGPFPLPHPDSGPSSCPLLGLFTMGRVFFGRRAMMWVAFNEFLIEKFRYTKFGLLFVALFPWIAKFILGLGEWGGSSNAWTGRVSSFTQFGKNQWNLYGWNLGLLNQNTNSRKLYLLALPAL